MPMLFMLPRSSEWALSDAIEWRPVLLLTVASYHGDGHSVLTVRTNEGDLVLDNLTNSVRDWSSTPYSYFARQAQGNGRHWERIGAAKPVGTTATGT